MVNYQNGKIYKIVDNTNEDIYIGSTCLLLCQRLASHKDDFKRWKNGKGGYTSSFKILENNNCKIILIENYPCENKEQLRMREQYYKEQIKCINKRDAYSSYNDKLEKAKQYKQDHIEEIKEQTKKYREEHKEEIKEWKKQYNEEHKEEIKEQTKKYRENNKDKVKQWKKQWNENNIDKVKQMKKEYYENNKEQILQNGKIWRENNKELKKEQDKQYRENNKEKIKYSRKEHYENNKEQILQRNKQYREKNKEKIKEKVKEKIQCPICNSEITKPKLKRHQQTIKCQSYKNNLT